MKEHYVPEPETLRYWQKTGIDRVSLSDVELLESLAKGCAPQSYVQFVTTYGAVDFCFSIPNWFAIGPIEGWQRSGTTVVHTDAEIKQPRRQRQAISHLKTSQSAAGYYRRTRECAEVSMPHWLVPIGGDYGEGQLLLEFGLPTERVFYWNADEHDWDGASLTWVGLVASDFESFLANLTADE